MMYMELKIAILEWLRDNENRWNRVVDCFGAFRQYIYDNTGSYLIGGKDVKDFIVNADMLLFCKRVEVKKIIED